MKKFLNEFKEFVSRGNAFDMAVGLILGTGFTSIVNSLVNDIIIPIISSLTIKVNLSDLKFTITGFDQNVIAINYGSFIQNVIDFLIAAFCIFIVVKTINKLKKKRNIEKDAKEAAKVSDETKALREIIDILKEKQ